MSSDSFLPGQFAHPYEIDPRLSKSAVPFRRKTYSFLQDTGIRFTVYDPVTDRWPSRDPIGKKGGEPV